MVRTTDYQEALGGKFNVVCTSKDERNPQPSSDQLKDADFVFYRTFNVVTFSVSEKIEDTISGVEGNYYFSELSFHILFNQNLIVDDLLPSFFWFLV